MVKKYSVAMLVFVVVVAVVMSGYAYFINNIYMEQRQEAYNLAKSYTDVIDEQTMEAGKLAAKLGESSKMKPGMKKWLANEGKELLEKDKNIVGVELTQFGKVNIPYSYPASFSLKKEAGAFEAWEYLVKEKADGDGNPKMIGPIELNDGTLGTIAVYPIYFFNAKTNNFDQWGTASVVWRLPDLISSADIPSITEKNYAYALYGNNPLLTDEGLIMKSDAELPADTESSAAVVPQGLWLLKVAPAEGFSSGPPLPAIIGISLLLGALSAAAVVSKK